MLMIDLAISCCNATHALTLTARVDVFVSLQQYKVDSEGQYHYNQVMGPDEYAWPVNNSAYVNVVAGISLNFAAEAARVLGFTGPVYADFEAKAKNIVVPFSKTVPGGYTA